MKRRDAVSTASASRFLQCTARHVRNLFWRGEIEGYFKATGKGNRGLMLYADSLEGFKGQEYDGRATLGESWE